MKQSSILVQLAQYLLDGDPTLGDEVALSYKKPKKYLSQFREDLAQRGIDHAVPQLPWIALVDGLWRRGYLIELDWKANPMEFLNAVETLLKKRNAPKDLIDELHKLEINGKPPEDVLEILGQNVRSHGFSLVEFDIDSDSHPLSIVSKDINNCMQLVEAAGYGKLIVFQ